MLGVCVGGVSMGVWWGGGEWVCGGEGVYVGRECDLHLYLNE